jgi:putative OPT family oligopeptide transporter
MSDKLPRADVVSEGDTPAHKPFVPPESNMRELTPVTLIMGSILGVVFALSSVYLGLKVGLTVSASIPVAVLSITLFRWLRMRGTILENNIVQTTGSAGESLAAGVAFTLPSLLLMGFDMELVRVLLVALLGGLIGVLMMIPLRHGLIVKEHGKLTYPEGTACADVLIAGEKGGTEATTIFTGFFIGLIYSFLSLITRVWGEVSTIAVDMGGKLKKATIGFEVSPTMLGVGYIIGPRVSANMLAGGLLAFVVLIPMIAQFGGESVAALSPGDLRTQYVLYIGAGAVATGGFIALGRSIPTIISAFRRGLGNLGASARDASVPRTEQDLSMKVVLGGSAVIVVASAVAPVLDISFVSAILVVLFGFFFVTVSSRITGEIGSSSNPISGMTIATLLLTCGLFVLAHWTGVGYKAMALTTAALVCVAASNGGTISQDLKTGYLVGATPRKQQIAILVGVITSAVAIGFTMLMLNTSRTTYQGVRYERVALSAAQIGNQTGTGPDGQHYRVAYLREEVSVDQDLKDVPEGRYLVNDAGELMYQVEPTTSGYPWRLEEATGRIPDDVIKTEDAKLKKGEEAPFELGTNRRPYRVIVLPVAIGDVAAGRYLVNPAGQIVYAARQVTTYRPVRQEGVTIPVGTLNPETEIGPDGQTYHVFDRHLQTVPRGKYLVNEAGELAFRVDSSVGDYPWKLEAATGTLPQERIDQTLEKMKKEMIESGQSGVAALQTDLGIDRKPYRVIDLGESKEGPRPGRYYIDDQNQIAYYARPLAKYDAPKAHLFQLIIDGVLGGKLPWGLVLIGVFIAIILELVGVASLPFAVGLYLPVSTSGAIFVGGAVRWMVDRKRKDLSAAESEFSPGMLMASGLIAGGAITGVVQSVILTAGVDKGFDLSDDLPASLVLNETWWPLLPFLLMGAALYWVALRKKA